jgi:hypothetical protein
MEYFKLKEGGSIEPIAKEVYERWRETISAEDVVIRRDKINDITITTLFTGIKSGKSDLFCTVSLESSFAEVIGYNSTQKDAVEFHVEQVKKVKEAYEQVNQE